MIIDLVAILNLAAVLDLATILVLEGILDLVVILVLKKILDLVVILDLVMILAMIDIQDGHPILRKTASRHGAIIISLERLDLFHSWIDIIGQGMRVATAPAVPIEITERPLKGTPLRSLQINRLPS